MIAEIDPNDGITLELCAGIIDKADKTPREIARMEIFEECGYDVPLEAVEEIQVAVTLSLSIALFYLTSQQ